MATPSATGRCRRARRCCSAKGDRAVEAVREVTAADSAAVSGKLPGMLRTPEFVITSPRVWYRVSGSGQAFLVVDSHRMLAGPLHGSTKLALHPKGAKDGKGGWAWVSHDATAYVGQRAHVEFTPGGATGRLAVAAVVQSESEPPTVPVHSLVVSMIDAPAPQSGGELAARYQSLFSAVIGQVGAGDISDSPDARDRARLAAWVVRHRELFGDSAEAGAADAMKDYRDRRAALLARVKDSPTAMAMLDGNGIDEHVLLRGSHKTPGDVVPRRFLEASPGRTKPRSRLRPAAA